MKRVIALVAGALLLMVSPAAGQAQGMSDPDDMTSPLDVRAIYFTAGNNDVHTFELTTDDKWRCRYISKLGKILWYFDGSGGRGMDLVGKLRCLEPQDEPRELVMFFSGTDSGNSYEPIPVRRPNRRSIRFRLPFDIPELDGPHVELVVRVRDGMAEGCTAANPCKEKAPDDGRWALY